MGLHAPSLGSAAQGTVQEEEAWRIWQVADLLEAEGEEPLISAEVRWGEMWGGLDSCRPPTSCLPRGGVGRKARGRWGRGLWPSPLRGS